MNCCVKLKYLWMNLKTVTATFTFIEEKSLSSPPRTTQCETESVHSACARSIIIVLFPWRSEEKCLWNWNIQLCFSHSASCSKDSQSVFAWFSTWRDGLKRSGDSTECDMKWEINFYCQREVVWEFKSNVSFYILWITDCVTKKNVNKSCSSDRTKVHRYEWCQFA